MSGTTINPYRFGGRVGCRRDQPGRYYVRARHLETTAGRWVSRDPFTFDVEKSNLYRYAANNPTTLVDPTGKWPVSPHYSMFCCNWLIKSCCPSKPKPPTKPSLPANLANCILHPKLCPDKTILGVKPPTGSGNEGLCSYILANTMMRACKDDPVAFLKLIPGIPENLITALEKIKINLPGYKVDPSLGICDCMTEAICKDLTGVSSYYADCAKGATNGGDCINCCNQSYGGNNQGGDNAKCQAVCDNKFAGDGT